MSDADFQRGERAALRWAAEEARRAVAALSTRPLSRPSRGAIAALSALAEAIDPETGQGAPSAHDPPASAALALDRAIASAIDARSCGYTGDECRECGSMHMVRNGTCLKCENCGATTGCS